MIGTKIVGPNGVTGAVELFRGGIDTLNDRFNAAADSTTEWRTLILALLGSENPEQSTFVQNLVC